MKTYRVAGEDILADVGDSILQELRCPSGSLKIGTWSDEDHGLILDGPGWVSGRWHHVRCTSTYSGFRIEIENIGNFRVAADGSSFSLVERSPNIENSQVDCAAVGPPLILALALRQKFCLHASAISHDGRVVAFAGGSGAGKSTTARLLPETWPEVFSRCGDDVLPVGSGDDHVVTLPHFPQLKLDPNEQAWITHPPTMPLAIVYMLDSDPSTKKVVSQPLPKTQAVLSILSRTIASRLFDRRLQEEYLEFCAVLAQRVAIRSLSYPFTSAALPDIRDTIIDDLEQRSAFQ